MHVLVTADTVGGVWSYARELVTGLAQRDVRVTLVGLGRIPTSAQTEWLRPLDNVDFRPTAFRLEWMPDAAPDIAASTEYLLRVIEEVKPDLLHFNQYCYGGIAGDLPRIVVAHSDVVSWWAAVHHSKPEPGEWINWYRDVVGQGLHAATEVVAISNVVRSDLQRHFGVAGARVIYNGTRPSPFAGQDCKQPVVLTVGRVWDQAKNVALLMKAQLDCPVFVAGSPDNPASGGQAELPAAANVTFAGELGEPELQRLYARTAIYVATSQYEPFGLAPVEAAFSRCAIVANDIPTFHELWGDSILYFKHNNASSLREIVARLLSDGDLRQAYAERAYRHALGLFTSDAMTERYIQLYRWLAESHSVSTSNVTAIKGAHAIS